MSLLLNGRKSSFFFIKVIILYFRDLSTENLVYLTSQQALGDLAFFIEGMNKEYNLTSDVKWIVFGGSYPGNLAAWARQKYPHLVHGAMSASGPLLAHLDFSEYFMVVADALRASNEMCPHIVKRSFVQVKNLLKTEVGQKKLNEQFNLCEDISEHVNNSLFMSNFFMNLAENFAGVVQYNNDNSAGIKKKNLTVDRLCNVLLDESTGLEINRLAAVTKLILDADGNSCFDYNYNNMVDSMKEVSWDSDAAYGSRQWTYQTCTEFGYFQTSSYKPHIFGTRFPLSFSIQQCLDTFGSLYNETFLNHAIERTNVLYGGLDIEVSNVVFVQGSLDPWHVLGVTKTLNDKAPAIVIEGK
uniref:Serine protease F56F10.1 n=1 Tax=Diabrotica virgifera virgifera TaxID=50390 RepID=A0A6P7GPI4_DIAVI